MSTAELPADARSKLVTAEQLLRGYHDQRCELIQGRVVSMSPTDIEHGDVSNEIAYLLNVAVRERQIGKLFIAEAGFVVSRDPDTVRVPDVAFVTHERLTKAGVSRGFFPGAPDLAVEVVSPSDSAPRVHEQARILTDQSTLDGGDVGPGFSHRVGELFPEAP